MTAPVQGVLVRPVISEKSTLETDRNNYTFMVARDANKYLNDEAPWVLIESDRSRAATVLYVALRAVDSLKILFAPFLPFSAQRLHEMLGHDDVIAGQLAFQTVAEDGAEHVVLTGDYSSWSGRWAPSELTAGQALREPRPLFVKLDADAVVANEIARMQVAAAP